MNIFEAIRTALGRIMVNKLRSFLTMLGIIIGVSSVITITTIGSSLKATLSDSLNNLGGINMLECYVSPVYPEKEEDWESFTGELYEEDYITQDMISAYKYEMGDKIKYVVQSEFLCMGKYEKDGRSAKNILLGATPGFLDSVGFSIIRGRNIDEEDEKNERKGVVVSDLFAKYAFSSDEDPIGKEIAIENNDMGVSVNLVIVGVYKYKKTPNDMKEKESDLRTYAVMPYSTVCGMVNTDYDKTQYFNVVLNKGVESAEIVESTKEFFNQYYADNGRAMIEVYSPQEELKEINKVLDILTIAISIIAAISLIVGGVGVMNIMLVSIMERTKEIGIRKALGAKNSNIRMQFLVEAVSICIVGGIIGIALGILNGSLIGLAAKNIISSVATDYADMLTITIRPSMTAIVISVVFSSLIGIVFGLYPANKAAKMSPIDALRYE